MCEISVQICNLKLGVTSYNFKIILYYLSISFHEDRFGLENSADSDEMLYYAAFHLGLHCDNVCQSTLLGVSGTQMVNMTPLECPLYLN